MGKLNDLTNWILQALLTGVFMGLGITFYADGTLLRNVLISTTSFVSAYVVRKIIAAIMRRPYVGAV